MSFHVLMHIAQHQPRIQRCRKSKTLEWCLFPSPTHSVFWSLKFWVLKFEVYGLPRVEWGRSQLFALWHVGNNGQNFIALNHLWFRGNCCGAHSGFTLVGISLHYTIAISTLPRKIQLCGTEAETQAAESKESSDKYGKGRRWNGSYEARGLLLFLQNTYMRVNSASTPAS